MADIRPKDLATTATSPVTDDYLLLDGTTEGTRKISADGLPIAAKGFGAEEDGAVALGVSMTAGSPTITRTTGDVFPADCVGKPVWIGGAGTADAILETTILSRTSDTVVTAAANAVTTVADSWAAFGTDDNAALAAAIASGKPFKIHRTALIGDPLAVGSNVRIEGGRIFQADDTENVFQLSSGGTEVHLKDLIIEYGLPSGWDFTVGPNGRGVSGPGTSGAPFRSLDLFEHCTFINSNKQAFSDFNGADYTRIVNCRVLNSGRAGFVFSGDTFGPIVSGNILENTGDDVVAFNGRTTHAVGIGNVIRGGGLVGPLTGIPHNLVAAGTAFKVHGKNITILGNAIKNCYTAFLSVKPNNYGNTDLVDSPDNIVFANNVCTEIYEPLVGASNSNQVCVQTMTGNSTRAVTIGRIIVANNTFEIDPTVNAVCSFFRNRHPTKVVHLNNNMARGVHRCFTIEDHLETLVVNGGYYEYTDIAGRFVADLDAAETALVNRIEINGGEYRRPTGSNVEFIRTGDNIDIDELIIRGIRVYGNHNDLLRIRGDSHIDTIRLEDCLKNDAPFYSVTLFDNGTYNHLFINGVEHITTVASAAAGDGNTTLVTGMAWDKRYKVTIAETEAFNGDASKTVMLGTAGGGSTLLAPVSLTGATTANAIVDGAANAGSNLVLSWTNNAAADAGALRVTVRVAE